MNFYKNDLGFISKSCSHFIVPVRTSSPGLLLCDIIDCSLFIDIVRHRSNVPLAKILKSFIGWN